jgi:hypothetical protein
MVGGLLSDEIAAFDHDATWDAQATGCGVRFQVKALGLILNDSSTKVIFEKMTEVVSVFFRVLCFLSACPATEAPARQPSTHPNIMINDANTTVITDLSISFDLSTVSSTTSVSNCSAWHLVDKDIYLHSGPRSAYLTIAQKQETELTPEQLVVTDFAIGQRPNELWESRPGEIWILRNNYTGNISDIVTGIDVLFGIDAVEPRTQWHLTNTPIRLDDTPPDLPVARLSMRRGRVQPRKDNPPDLRVKEDGTFKIVQVSDTHMVTGVGSCKDSIDADGNFLPESVADPLTVKFIDEVLDVEKPDLVLLTGDEVHHDIPDTQSALFKVVAPLIERSIPYAAVFGNHDSEGAYALSRKLQSFRPISNAPEQTRSRDMCKSLENDD